MEKLVRRKKTCPVIIPNYFGPSHIFRVLLGIDVQENQISKQAKIEGAAGPTALTQFGNL